MTNLYHDEGVMNKSVYILIMLFFILILSSIGIAQTVSNQQIVNKVNKLLGFDEIEYYKATEELISVEKCIGVDTTTPFIGPLLNKKEIWKLKYGKLPYFYKVKRENFKEKNLDVYVDTNGNILKIHAYIDNFDEAKWRKPSTEEAEQQHARYEKFYGFVPVDSVKVTFYDLLYKQNCDYGSAEEIIAFCGEMTTFQHDEPQPMWYINAYGLPQMLHTSDPVPFYQKDHIWKMIDAITGEFLIGGSTPQPKRP